MAPTVPRRRYRVRLSVVVAALLGATGCRVERVYTRVQSEDAYGLVAPIRHTVRVKVDPTARRVTWLQDLRDARGTEHHRVTTFGAYGFGTCEIFDADNWTCIFKSGGRTVLAPTMKDGELSEFYFVKVETYRRGYRALGITVPAPF